MSNWVGIDGFISPTVEQTGTASDCYFGQTYYYAWYEFYPAASYTVFNVRPGDTIKAEVSYLGSDLFTTTIKDVNTGQSFTSAPTLVPGAETDSAEWVSESAFGSLGELGLTPVTPVTFTNAMATIGGATRTISGWGNNAYWMLEVDYNFGFNQETGIATPYTETLAFAKGQPSALVRGDQFTFDWLSSGP